MELNWLSELLLVLMSLFSNDKFPRAFNSSWDLVKTYVGEGASIGAGAVIVCGVNIGCYSMVAAGSLVTKDIAPYGLALGQPAKIVDYVTKNGVPIKHDMTKPYTGEKYSHNE